jgi:hypothetical protein
MRKKSICNFDLRWGLGLRRMHCWCLTGLARIGWVGRAQVECVMIDLYPCMKCFGGRRI